jgi:hypothetical protein
MVRRQLFNYDLWEAEMYLKDGTHLKQTRALRSLCLPAAEEARVERILMERRARHRKALEAAGAKKPAATA